MYLLKIIHWAGVRATTHALSRSLATLQRCLYVHLFYMYYCIDILHLGTFHDVAELSNKKNSPPSARYRDANSRATMPLILSVKQLNTANLKQYNVCTALSVRVRVTLAGCGCRGPCR